MRLSKLIHELQMVLENQGDLQVFVVDGYDNVIYNGDYSVDVFIDKGRTYVDIGIGGTKVESQ